MPRAQYAFVIIGLADVCWSIRLTLEEQAEQPLEPKHNQHKSAAELVRMQHDTQPFLRMEFDPWHPEFDNAYEMVLNQYVYGDLMGRPFNNMNGQTRLGQDMGKAKKPTIFLHMHKQAGSFICSLAIVNGERPVAPNVNCNWLAHDHIWKTDFNLAEEAGIFSDIPVSCENRTQYFKKYGFSFGAIEREMHASDLCPDFQYATLIKEPAAYLQSVIPYEDIRFKEASFKECGLSNEVTINQTYVDPQWMNSFLDAYFASPSCWSKKTANMDERQKQRYEALTHAPWKWIDNYVIRSIVGEEAYNAGPGMIGPKHLQMALDRLSKFQKVVTVDGQQVFDGYIPEIGWNTKGKPKKINTAKGRNAKQLFDDATMQRLLDLNKYDVQLFEHFRKL